MMNKSFLLVLTQQSEGQSTYPDWVILAITIVILLSAARELMDITNNEMASPNILDRLYGWFSDSRSSEPHPRFR